MQHVQVFKVLSAQNILMFCAHSNVAKWASFVYFRSFQTETFFKK